MSAPEIKGWCPGALRPMASGDGLLIRAKVVGCAITTAQAIEIAAIADDCGNGLIDLSQRAQLQLRGLSEARLPEALRRLADMALLAPDAGSESVMNVLVAPLAGLSPAAPFDANALALSLAKAVADDAALRNLPGKFLFLVDDASPLGLAQCDADIRLEAQGADIAVVLGGARDMAVVVARDAAVATALKLARAFVALRARDPFALRRMASQTRALGAATVFDAAGLSPTPYRSACVAAMSAEVFGAQSYDGVFFAGAGAAQGRWLARDLAAFVGLAERAGARELRLTPWRALLAPTPSLAAARDLAAGAAALDLITNGDDPRLSVIACPGAPECPQARGATRDQLDRIAPLAKILARAEGVGLHVTGCAKGCAHPAPAPITLLVENGGFDLIDNGRASDAPTLRGLSLEALLRELTARAETSQESASHESASQEGSCPTR